MVTHIGRGVFEGSATPLHIAQIQPPELGIAVAPLPWDGGVVDTLKPSHFPCVLPSQIWYSASKAVCINRREWNPQNCGALGPTSCGKGMVDP